MSKKKRTRPQASPEIASPPPAARRSFSPSHRWILGLILAGTFLAFANTLANGFAYDDTTQILRNDQIRSFANLPTALTKEVWFWRVKQDQDPNKDAGPTTPYYRPLFTVYLMVGWALFGTWAPGWHLINVLMHLLAVSFLFLILKRITGDIKLTSIATLLFALHPLRVESVAWISGVTDLFLALFLLPSFYLYLRYRENGNKNYLAGSIFLFLFAAFSKEPAVAFPAFIAAYELFIAKPERPLAQRLRAAVFFPALFLMMALTYFVMRYNALGFVLNDPQFVSYPLHQVLLTIPIVICKYVGLLLWPMNLSIFHDTPMVTTPFSPRFLLPLLGVAALVYGGWRLWGQPVARFAILWFAINLLPVLNLSAFGTDFLVQERYVYIPSVGFTLLLAMALVRIPTGQRAKRLVTRAALALAMTPVVYGLSSLFVASGFALDDAPATRTGLSIAITLLVAAGLAFVPAERWQATRRLTIPGLIVGILALQMAGKTAAQNAFWKDDMTLWSHSAEVADDQAMAHFVLGHKYIDRQQMDKAVEELEKFMTLRQNNTIVLNNLAAAHLLRYEEEYTFDRSHADRGHIDRAIALCDAGLALNPAVSTQASMYDLLGKAYSYETPLKNLDRSIYFFQTSLRLEPENPIFSVHLGTAYFKQQKLDAAQEYLTRALQQTSEIPDLYKVLAAVYQLKGQLQEAIQYYDLYLKKTPNAVDAATITQQVKDLRAQLNPQS
ncbi:MAG TPA: tetratricopeptide repeat protein [Blastocatellia bacterium]|nr:tetratricopeptide repeat protein [Blastocatellia bacterium]